MGRGFDGGALQRSLTFYLYRCLSRELALEMISHAHVGLSAMQAEGEADDLITYTR